MNSRIKELLSERSGNYILPFFWQHGEDEAVLRKYMGIIQNSSIGAVCVESRPHPDFCGPRWWRDMDIILDEARKRDMKVWILDDSHFPTGFANGAMKTQSDERCRRSIVCKAVGCAGSKRIRLDKGRLLHPEALEKSSLELTMEKYRPGKIKARKFDDDLLLCVSALRVDENHGRCIDLTGRVQDGILEWDVPKGKWKLYILHVTGNAGYHPDYINMMDAASCRVLLDAVYEPHYARYKDDFGKTIAGFFSDEPELGNGHLYDQGNLLGTDQDLPWSGELEMRLKRELGEDYAVNLPLLWENEADPDMTARIRYGYMNAVTRLVEKDFSLQIGDWCRTHGVEYIGHIIEDNNQHARTGSSLGHYFRCLAGQDMAGIDVIGNQVVPLGEDTAITGQIFGNRDGEFFHYVLAKLGVSCGAIDPAKHGRCMCEIFGNYGWAAGVRLEKYLADHFMVRGVNYYVPHAFSPKTFPDPDCPPHFYAQGHNPQYRHFGRLMAYMNRICALISNGRHIAPAAVLYHAEAEWTGPYMLTQKPCRLLAEAQIDYDIIPQDVFAEQDRYRTVIGKTLKVNTQEYRALIVPAVRYVTAEFLNAAVKLEESGFPVIFIDTLPEGICNASGDDFQAVPERLRNCTVLPLNKLTDFLKERGIPDIVFSPVDRRLRCLRYVHHDGMSLYYFVNEGSEPYRGVIRLPETTPGITYNAWDNCLETVDARPAGGGMEITAEIDPLKSFIVIFDKTLSPTDIRRPPLRCNGNAVDLNEGWKRSVCAGINYPQFSGKREITLPDMLAEEQPEFSGYVRYERRFSLGEHGRTILEITDAHEGVEVFVNGISAGIQIAPPFRYDISALVKIGKNSLAVEVATTLERQIGQTGIQAKMMNLKPTAKSGITGTVRICTKSVEKEACHDNP